MESATRKTTQSRRLLSGLAKCIQDNLKNTASWKQAKENGERLFKKEYGSSFEVFNKRPVPENIVSYCAGDVRCLPKLREIFWTPGTVAWRSLVEQEAERRVALSQRSNYQPHGREKALAPWSKDQNIKLDQWNHVPPPQDQDFDDWYDIEVRNDNDDYWEDDSPTSCRDIISPWEYNLYYSD
jgi:exonuclease 3'-5' domain-containing protein 1